MEDQGRSEWPQYVELVGLHKFYFEYFIKAAAFSLGIQGALIAFVVKEKLSARALPIALAIPLLLAIGTTLVFALSITKTLDLKRQVERVQQRLGLSWRPHVEVLVWMSWVFVVLFGCASIGLLWLMRYGPRLLQG
jgi:hypothetical protein